MTLDTVLSNILLFKNNAHMHYGIKRSSKNMTNSDRKSDLTTTTVCFKSIRQLIAQNGYWFSVLVVLLVNLLVILWNR